MNGAAMEQEQIVEANKGSVNAVSKVTAPQTTTVEIPSEKPNENPILKGGDVRKRKTKPRKKGAASRGPTALPTNRGTGFEDYYADPPLTPEEAREEREEIYADDLSFEDRIQSCLVRFKGRRRLQTSHSRYFNEYLFLGGIDANPSPFSGLDPRELKNLTPAERREATRLHTINETAGEKFYNGDHEAWSVDFTGVASGFFSTALIKLAGYELDENGSDADAVKELNIGISVVENFLRYVLQHDVCPEHVDDLKQALQICSDAREEIPMLARLQRALPGEFNLMAAKLFSVHDEHDWALHNQGALDLDPKVVFYSSLALIDDATFFNALSEGEHHVTRQYECTIKLTKILRPSKETVKRFRSLEIDKSPLNVDSIGEAVFVPTTIEDGFDQPEASNPAKLKGISLFFNDRALANMKVGMKMAVTVCELDTGMKFIKTVTNIVPTYYTFLPQELMKFYKPPRENDRPGPSIHSLNEGHMDAEEGGKHD